jgi:2'-5' RNA ligase
VTLYRTFISIELGDETRQRAAELQEELRAAGARLRWVRPHNLHFTLRFLGEIPAAQVARAIVATRDAVRLAVPFDITVAGLGAFPSLERPQVIWVGTPEGSQALEGLAQGVNQALARERFPSDPRKFRPHLTLGRVRDDRRWGELVRGLHRFQDVVIGQERVEAVTVMESRLTVEGPVYTPREQVRLGHGLNPTGA